AVADALEQVDEDAAAEQVFELGLARSVTAHQPAERGDLVGRVVVDVHVGVFAEPRAHEVDERLKRGALARVVVRMQRREVAVGVEDPPEVLEAPLLVPERVALEVEEEVAGRRIGQEREAALGLRLLEDVPVFAALARVQLEYGLLANLCPGVGGETRRRLSGGATERGERADVRREELLDLRAANAGDAREVVDAVPVRVAERVEVADRAV